MKTLILTDDTYELLISALEVGDAVESREVLTRFGRKDKLPSDRDLVAMARRGDDAPSAVTLAVQRRDAGRQAAADTREDLKRLLLELHAAGVQPSVLKAWFGYSNSQLFSILGEGQTAQEPAAA